MPTAPARPCAAPGCPGLAQAGRFCLKHADRARDYDRQRGSAAARGYDAKWRRLRKLKLSVDPVCEAPGCEAPANEVDHIVAKARGGADRWENLQSLCKSCHSKKTYREDGSFRGRGRPAPDGGRGRSDL